MDDFILALKNTFLEEFLESASRMETLLMVLEKNPADTACINELFRLMHNTKGSSRAVGLDDMAKIAHLCENLLADVRSGKMPPSIKIVNLLLQALDAMQEGTQRAENTDNKSEIWKQAVNKLLQFQSTEVTKFQIIDSTNLLPQLEKESSVDGFTEFSTTADSKSPNPSKSIEISDNIDTKPQTNRHLHAENRVALDSNSQPNTGNSAKTEDSIRVNLSKLDEIQNKFGEQVIVQSTLDHLMSQNPFDFLQSEKMCAQLKKINRHLQSLILNLRMVPLSTIFVRLNRAVRDVALSTNKMAEIELVGGDSELDKNVLEQLIDPLVHMVRNSVDHGIEMPEERRLKNKPPVGTIKVTARRLGKYLEIQISDDGKGLSKEKILQKAYSTGILAKGFVPEDKEVFKLIFASGFSTKQAATEFSGRGVGMDVVRTNIERIGGVIDLSSVEGGGTTVKLKIPLTLAIVPGLIVKSKNQHFTIPQTDLVELVRIEADESKNEKIFMLQGIKVLKLREKILPLLGLNHILTKIDLKKANANVDSYRTNSVHIVILNADTCQFGLEVDSVEDTADVVVKPLPPFLKHLNLFSGASIMGDGSIALTLDVFGISKLANLTIEADIKHQKNLEGIPAVVSHHQMDTSEFLMVHIGVPGNYLIPVNIVSRLEEFEINSFEFSGEQRVVRYRDAILPVFSLPKFLNLSPNDVPLNQEKSQVVVIKRDDSYFGIEVVEILDIANLPPKINLAIRDRPGILGTMAFQDEALVVVDIFGIIDMFKNNLAKKAGIDSIETDIGSSSSKIEIANSRRKHRILIVENSSFFRTFMRKILTDAGYRVEVECNGAEAWNSLEHADANYFSLVLSDIEMPELNGLEMAKRISHDHRYSKIPLVAITTKYSSSNIQEGLEAGFSLYLEKLNAENLISEIDALLLKQISNSEPNKKAKLASSL
jgi:two-component system chemotaxis sensor kinase CheA